MKVIYSIGSTFGGVGIGNLASRAGRGIEKNKALYKLICLDYKKTSIPKEKIKSFWPLKYLFWYPLKGLQRYIFTKYNPYLFLDNFYDFMSLIHVKKCDIFHSWRGHSYRAIKKAKRLGAITIVENASSHPITQSKILQEEYKKYGLKFSAYKKKSLSRAIKELENADYITIPSDFVEKSFLDNGFPKKKLIKIPFGVDIKRFSPKKSKKDDKFRAIFVGSIQLRKGVQYLLQAWDELKLKNAELIVVGRVWDDAKEIVKQYKENPSIKFPGFMDLKEIYSESDVFVFPSIEEGSALVTYEAMASGLPIITTFNSGAVTRNGKDGFIIPIRDIKVLKEKIKYFYDHPKQIEKMGKSARKYVEKFTWEKYGDNLVKEYKKISKS